MAPGFTWSCLGGLCSLVWAGFPVAEFQPSARPAGPMVLPVWVCNNYYYYHIALHHARTACHRRHQRGYLKLTRTFTSRDFLPKFLFQKQGEIERNVIAGPRLKMVLTGTSSISQTPSAAGKMKLSISPSRKIATLARHAPHLSSSVVARIRLCHRISVQGVIKNVFSCETFRARQVGRRGGTHSSSVVV